MNLPAVIADLNAAEHDTDYEVKKEACEFWSSICENKDVPPEILTPYLSRCYHRQLAKLLRIRNAL